MNILRLARTGFLLSMLLSLFVVVPLEAQRGSQRGRRGQGQGPERMELERRVRARMAEMMREQLGLSDEEDARLSEIVQGFEQQRRQLGRQERAVRLRVESLVLEGGQDSAEAAELLQRMSALHMQEAELIQAEHQALLEVLTPMQVLRLVHLREQLGQRIQRLRGQPGRGDGRGGGRRGGAGDLRPGGGDIRLDGVVLGPFGGGRAFSRPHGSELPLLGVFPEER